MKTLLITLLISFVLGCDTIPNSPPVNSIGTGVLVKEAIDKTIDTLPKYQKKLKLPSFEACYLNEKIVICKIIGCKQNCTKAYYDVNEFLNNNKGKTYFVKKESLLKLLSFVDTYCTYNEKVSICDEEIKNYENINNIFIY